MTVGTSRSRVTSCSSTGEGTAAPTTWASWSPATARPSTPSRATRATPARGGAIASAARRYSGTGRRCTRRSAPRARLCGRRLSAPAFSLRRPRRHGRRIGPSCRRFPLTIAPATPLVRGDRLVEASCSVGRGRPAFCANPKKVIHNVKDS